MHRLLNKLKATVYIQHRHSTISEELRLKIRKDNFVGIKRMLWEQQLISDKMRRVVTITNKAEENQRIFEQLGSYELRELAVGLEYIGRVQREVKDRIIDLQTYKNLTSTYFSQLLCSTNSSVHPITRFIYLQNISMRTEIKINQVKMIQSLADRRTVEHQQFTQIISLQLFNITDMATLYEIFYQIYFPSLNSVNNIRQLHQALIYLSTFRKLPLFLPNKAINLIDQELSTNPYIYYSHFLQITNIIYLLLFKFSATINELRLKTTLEHLYKQVLEKPIIDQESRNSIESFQDLQLTFLKLKCLNINQIITCFEQRKSILQQQNLQINQAINLTIDQKQEQQFCINIILEQYLKSIQKLLDNQANQLLHKTFLEFKIKECRSLILASTMPSIDPSVLYDFVDQKIFKLFNKNVCVPQLQKSLQIADSKIKEKGIDVENHKNSKLHKLCNSFRDKLDKLITRDSINKITEELIKTQQNTRKDLSIIYSAPFEKLLWSADELAKLLELQCQYDLTKPNVLYLLKNDPEFLLSLMSWNINSFIGDFYLPKQFKSLGFSTEPCKYTEGVGFKVIKENQKKPIVLKIQSELNKNVVWDPQKTGYILRGGVRNILRTLGRLKKSH